MKILKINLGLFSLLAVLAASVFFTSCEQTEIVTENTNIDESVMLAEDLQGGVDILPPKGFEDKTDEEKQLFLEELSDEDAQKLAENYRIFDYLTSEGMLEKAEAMLDNGALFSDLDFSNMLSAHQLEEMSTYEIIDIESRGCYYRWIGCYYRPNGWWFCGVLQNRFKRVYRKYCSYNGKWYGYRYYFTNWSC